MREIIEILKAESEKNREEHKEILAKVDIIKQFQNDQNTRITLVEYKSSIIGAASGGIVALVVLIIGYVKSKMKI